MTVNICRPSCGYFGQWRRHFEHRIVSIHRFPVKCGLTEPINGLNRGSLISLPLPLSNLLLPFDFCEDDVNHSNHIYHPSKVQFVKTPPKHSLICLTLQNGMRNEKAMTVIENLIVAHGFRKVPIMALLRDNS
jgi:hypothetical protein